MGEGLDGVVRGTSGFRQLRERADLSQGEIAKMLGVSRQTVTEWELGHTSWEIERVNEYLSAVGYVHATEVARVKIHLESVQHVLESVRADLIAEKQKSDEMFGAAMTFLDRPIG